MLSRCSSCMFDCLSWMRGTKHLLPAGNVSVISLVHNSRVSISGATDLYAHHAPAASADDITAVVSTSRKLGACRYMPTC